MPHATPSRLCLAILALALALAVAGCRDKDAGSSSSAASAAPPAADPFEHAPHDAEAIRQRLQGTWIVDTWRSNQDSERVDDAPWGAKMILTIEGSTLTRDNGLSAVELQVDVLAPCLLRIRSDEWTTHETFVPGRGEAIAFGAPGFVADDGTIHLCDAALRRLFVGDPQQCRVLVAPEGREGAMALAGDIDCTLTVSDSEVGLKSSLGAHELDRRYARDGQRLCQFACKPPAPRHDSPEAARQALAP